MQERILLFIPCYNCEKQIVRVLKQLDAMVMQYISQVLIVNNCSTDGTEDAARDYLAQHDLPAVLVRNDENYGLGGSHKVAFLYAINYGFDYIITLHGDDQGRIKDFIPLLASGQYRQYDCCLGARFMNGSKLIGYGKIRILGNYAFNFLFSAVVRKKVKDLGSGLNMYKVASLISRYYMKYPDTLYFNDLMILASCYYKQNMMFYPISWREEDQISNNKLWSFSISLLKMLWHYTMNQEQYLKRDMRTKKIEEYTFKIVYEM